MEDPAIWSKPERAQELGRERARLSGELAEMDRADHSVRDALELLQLAETENDASTAGD
ncbi:MAG: peptide chain release factor 2, partial [Gammaproteobacteria bacterium]|nr:peptide chain release factor 2 [Gammaproteobacteria bacterium]